MCFAFCVFDLLHSRFDLHTGKIWGKFLIQLSIVSYIYYKLFIHVYISLIEKVSDTSCNSFILHSSADKMFRRTKRDIQKEVLTSFYLRCSYFLFLPLLHVFFPTFPPCWSSPGTHSTPFSSSTLPGVTAWYYFYTTVNTQGLQMARCLKEIDCKLFREEEHLLSYLLYRKVNEKQDFFSFVQ